MYYDKWKPSKIQAREFAELIDTIGRFCVKHDITASVNFNEYTFTIHGQKYHVSPHSKIFDDDTIHITASKTRIMDIYNDLNAGFVLDGRGYRK